MPVHQLTAQSAGPMEARDFFLEVVLPLLDTDWVSFGTLAFRLIGEGGCEITLDLDEGELFEGCLDDADCTVRGPAAVFLGLIRGQIEPDDALDQGILVLGNLAVLEAFSEMLDRGARA